MMKRSMILGMALGGLVFFLWSETAQAQFSYVRGRWGGYYTAPTWYGGPYYYGRSYYYPYYGGTVYYPSYYYGSWYYPAPAYGRTYYYSYPSYYYSYPSYPTWYGSTYWSSPYYGGVYYTTPMSYSTTATARSAVAPASYQSYYSGPAVDSDKVRLRVYVPTQNARLTIEGQPTQQTGTERTFVSPSLNPGEYTYTLRASWRDGDREVSREKQVQVRPGQETVVQFTGSDADRSS
jgi:uncharacterized protein (TIGR03000 family)